LVVYMLLTNSIYGANTPTGYWLLGGTLIVLVAIYIVARLKRGPDLNLAFAQIPPE